MMLAFCERTKSSSSDEKLARAKALGASDGINYRTEKVARRVMEMTGGEGVDMVIDSVVEASWGESLRSLRRGGRLVTCGATSGPSATINLMQLFQQQYRITGSFGCRIENIRQSLDKMAAGMKPVIDSVFPLEDFEKGLARLEGRQVFGKVVVTF